MQELAPQPPWPHPFKGPDRDAQLEQALDSLKIENGQLRQLVVRLSETIIKNVVTRR